MVKPRCVPGICFRGGTCTETAEGVECGPCPDGYTGDGFNCDDVDEVRVAGWRMSRADIPGYRLACANAAALMWIQMFFHGSVGRRFFLCSSWSALSCSASTA